MYRLTNTGVVRLTLRISSLLFIANLSVLNIVSAFNFEIRDPITKKGEPGSYFGYSLALHQIYEKSSTNVASNLILVGAPLGQNLQPETNRSGAFFKCPIDKDPTNCVQIQTDGRRIDEVDYDEDYDENGLSLRGPVVEPPLVPPGKDEIKNGQWLGVTVRSQVGIHTAGKAPLGDEDGKVMVCAHRYITGRNLTQSQHGFGLCYSFKNDLGYDSAVEPCKGRLTASEHLQFGYCQAGTSLDFLEDGVVLIGAPGPFTWRGTMFAWNIGEEYLKREKGPVLGPLNDLDKPIQKYSYMGMSVTGGKLFSKNEMIYATGAPRADYNGMVYLFKRKERKDAEMNIECTIAGKQFASNFGYEILATDTNNDGLDELLIAAPFEFTRKHGGVVYIYHNVFDCKLNNASNLKPTGAPLMSGGAEARFGWALASLGDINHDGYGDVAVGAPYEEGGGAIYIYLGGRNGLSRTPSQKIQHKESGLSTIGYSLSGGLDLDGNGYPDLATGAYESDIVILYKARSIIDITTTVRDNYKELFNINVSQHGCTVDRASNLTCFSFQTCLKLKDIPRDHIYFRAVITADIEKREAKFSRAIFDPDIHDQKSETNWRFSMLSQREYCTLKTVYIRDKIRDILSPIKFRVNYTLDDNKPNSPILNSTSLQLFDAKFQKDCGSDDKCDSELILMAELTKKDNSIILGEDKEIILDVSVENRGESAYEAQLFIVHSESLSYIALNDKLSNVKCTVFNQSLVSCSLGNPFTYLKTASLGIRFEGKQNDLSNENNLKFDVWVNSTSNELSKQTRVHLEANIVKNYTLDMQIGIITPYTVYGGDIKGESGMVYFDDIGGRVAHRYSVTNLGPWYAQNVSVILEWPLQVANNQMQGKWLLYLEDLPTIKIADDSPVPCTLVYTSIIREVNNLHLTQRQGVTEATIGELVAPPPPGGMNFTGYRRRRRRDVEMVVVADTLVSDDGQKRKVVVMDCPSGKAKCVQFNCLITQLKKDEEAAIEIKSRLWNSTFVEDYSNVDYVRISSMARIEYGAPSTVISSSAITVAYPEQQPIETPHPLWVYIVAAVAGIIVLLVIILILWKCGFFKRQRVKDHTLSGNLQKKDENDSLLSGKQ